MGVAETILGEYAVKVTPTTQHVLREECCRDPFPTFGASKTDPMNLLALNNFLPLLDLCDTQDKADLAKFILQKVPL